MLFSWFNNANLHISQKVSGDFSFYARMLFQKGNVAYNELRSAHRWKKFEPVQLNRTNMSTCPELRRKPQEKKVRNEGVLALWKGWVPSYMRLGPHFLVSFPLLELLRTQVFQLPPI